MSTMMNRSARKREKTIAEWDGLMKCKQSEIRDKKLKVLKHMKHITELS